MAPHAMESILQPPQWPAALSNFVTWCLMWDPKNRPTSSQALNHEYFADAVDPLRPKSSTSRLLGRKQSDKSFKSLSKEPGDSPSLSSKSSWFRRSIIGRSESPAPAVEQDNASRVSHNTTPDAGAAKSKSITSKRATWAHGAPMPILPSIRPVSPLSNAVTAQASNSTENGKSTGSLKPKIGRQLSVNSHGNHYAEIHRQEAERALNGGGSITSSSTHKESFFAHLRKRARRLSGRNQIAAAPANDDVEANAGCVPWSNRSSMALDSVSFDSKSNDDFSDLDKALQNVRYSIDASSSGNVPPRVASPPPITQPKRQSMPQGTVRSVSESQSSGPVSSRARRAMQMSTHPVHRYETPEEEDELLDEVLQSTSRAARHLAEGSLLDSDSSHNDDHSVVANDNGRPLPNPYPTPSPSAKCDGILFGEDQSTPSRQAKGANAKTENGNRQWPTPPYEENEWASSATASIFATGSTYG